MELLYQPINEKNFSLIEKELFNIYILAENGDILYPNQVLFKDLDDFHQIGLSNFIRAMESFVKDIGGQELNSIQLGDETFFSKVDEITKITFLYKTDKMMQEKRVSQLLNKIKNAFLHHFTGKFTADDVEKTKLMHDFIESIIKILKEQNKVKNFLTAL